MIVCSRPSERFTNSVTFQPATRVALGFIYYLSFLLSLNTPRALPHFVHSEEDETKKMCPSSNVSRDIFLISLELLWLLFGFKIRK